MALVNLSKHLRIILQTTACLNCNNICQSVSKEVTITFQRVKLDKTLKDH